MKNKLIRSLLSITLFGALLTLSACGSSISSTITDETTDYIAAVAGSAEKVDISENINDYGDDFAEKLEYETEEVFTEEEVEKLYDGSIGPLLYKGSIEDSLTVYQYAIETGEKQEVFSFDNDNNYSTTVGLDINAIPSYQLKQIFDKEMSKMAVQWYDSSDSSWRVGWTNKEGNLTDITGILHPATSDFTSVVPYDTSPIFTSDGLFMFSDHNNEKYVFVNTDTKEVIREEDVILDAYNNPIWDVLLLPNGKMVKIISLRGDQNYTSCDFGEFKVIINNNNNFSGGVAGFDLIDNAVVVGIGKVDRENSIGKYGEGFTELGKYNQYDDGDWSNPVFEKLTPPTDYLLESCAYNNGQIVFIGTRGENRFLFIIEDGSGEQTVNQIAEIPKDEHLLFWR